MGISLYGLTPATTYDALIKVGDNGPITGALKVLSDGLGTNLPMEASTTAINFTGTAQVGGVGIANTTQVAAKQDTLVSGTNIKTINGTSVLGSGNIAVVTSPSGVAGAIQFSNGSAFASDASNLFWDDTNNRLGVGTNAPTATAHFKGSGSTSATTSLLVQNSAGTAALTVKDDLSATFGGSLTIPNFQGITSANNSIGFETGRIIFSATANTFAGQYAFNFSDGGGNNTGTSGTTGRFNLISRFAPTSGTAVYNTASINPTVNQTGGANGITRGLFIDPTLTAAADFRAIEVSIGGAYINTTSVQASAILQADSTTKGFLPPRMTTTQKNAIATPAAGLVVYDTTLAKLCVRTASAWETITSL